MHAHVTHAHVNTYMLAHGMSEHRWLQASELGFLHTGLWQVRVKQPSAFGRGKGRGKRSSPAFSVRIAGKVHTVLLQSAAGAISGARRRKTRWLSREENLTLANKAHREREIRTSIPTKGEQGAQGAHALSSRQQNIQATHFSCKETEMWSNTEADGKSP